MTKSIQHVRIPWLALAVSLAAKLVPSIWAEPSAARRTPVVEAVAKIMPSVVSIGTTKERFVRVQSPFRSYYDNYFRVYGRVVTEYQPLGTGVVVDSAGLILTNYHVVEGQSTLLVRLGDDQKQHEAQMLAHDHINDLCLLKVVRPPNEEEPLVPVTFALPGDLLLGETVIAVGNPFGYEHSITKGVLSARNRAYGGADVAFDDILQTDAAINPGNSGGPLINLDGHLIGINVAIRQGAEGIGFAIPLARIEKVLAHWLVPARLSNAFCGLTASTVVEDGKSIAAIAEVRKGSPAEKAGLRQGMVVETVDGEPVHRAVDIGRRLFLLKAGDTVRLGLRGGETVPVKLRTMSDEELIYQRLGIRVQPLTQALRQAMGLATSLRALAISEVVPGSDLDSRRTEYGNVVRRGDLLAFVAKETAGGTGAPVATGDVKTLGDLLRDAAGGDNVSLLIYAMDTIDGRPNLARIKLSIILD